MNDLKFITPNHVVLWVIYIYCTCMMKTLLITLDKQYIASMPCNPSIGGPAKGVIVREIDALGGEMAKNIDKTLIQINVQTLNPYAKV